MADISNGAMRCLSVYFPLMLVEPKVSSVIFRIKRLSGLNNGPVGDPTLAEAEANKIMNVHVPVTN